MSNEKNTPARGGARMPSGHTFRRTVLWLLALSLAGLAAFLVYAWQPELPEVAKPDPSKFSTGSIRQGERLASAGFCAGCHSVMPGKPFAGGYAMKTPFGTIYSTNISPDTKTGIGSWSEAAFRRAMREGVARDGSHLFPAFPFDHFTKLSDEDVHALYAFMMTRPPIPAPNHPNEMPFPFGVRALQAGWKLLFFRDERFVPPAGQDAMVSRGAYLAEGLSHCSACHTPRGVMGQELSRRLYDGAAIDGWFAPALTVANPSPVPWTSDELQRYLTTGLSQYHGSAAGPMAPVAHGLSALSAEDQQALVAYVESLSGGDARKAVLQPAVTAALTADAQDHGRLRDANARLFISACASCHYNSGQAKASRPDLGLNSAVHVDDPSNLIRVIMYGIDARDGAPGIVMPGFAQGLSDDDIVRIAAYLRTTRTNKPLWPDLPAKVAAIRLAGKGESH